MTTLVPVTDNEQPTPGAVTSTATSVKPKTVLFVTRSPEFGGTEKHLIQLIEQLSRGNVQIRILCLENDNYSNRLAGTQVEVKVDHNLTSTLKWLRVLREERPDVVVFVRSWLWCFPWYTHLIAWIAGIPKRYSIVHLPASPQPKIEGGPVQKLVAQLKRARKIIGTKRLAWCCTSMICVSDAIRNGLVNEYRLPPGRVVTVHNGVSIPESSPRTLPRLTVRSRLAINPDEFLLICVARLTPQKRVDVLLAALAKVIRECGQVKCVIVGDGPLREQLWNQAVDLGLTKNIRFEGFQDDVRQYLLAADAFVLTSDFEGFPLSILEAMACGLPCVVTNVGGNAEAVTNGMDGYVVPAESPDSVAEAILFLARNSIARSTMSALARERVIKYFNIEDRMAQIQQLILTDV